MAFWCYLLICLLSVVVVLYVLLELHYFLRMCWCVLLARFVKRKCHILDVTSVTGFCLTNDIDTLLNHMNNARYLRELDFARVDFYERTNLYRTIVARGGSVFQGASTIRYRRFIRPFSRYQITSKIIYWDEQFVYMEHRFVRPADQFVHTIAVCRQRIVDCSAADVMAELLAPAGAQLQAGAYSNAVSPTGSPDRSNTTTTTTTTTTAMAMTMTMTTTMTSHQADQAENGQARVKLKPEVPPDLLKWIEYNEVSSKQLRTNC